MDTYRPDIVDYCLSLLAAQFGLNSLRFRRYSAVIMLMQSACQLFGSYLVKALFRIILACRLIGKGQRKKIEWEGGL
jgi:hypothetical protein